MISKRISEIVVNVNAVQMFQDLDEIVMGVLRTLEGRCHADRMVRRVLRIVKRSNCYIMKSSLNGDGTINAMFEFDALTYRKGDIVPLCEIKQIERNNYIYCQNDHAHVIINSQERALRTLRVGQRIPATVLQCSYDADSPRVTILGDLYRYPTEAIAYYLHGEATEEDRRLLVDLLLRVSAERALHSNLDSAVVKFFNELLYPYEAPPGEKGAPLVELATALTAEKKQGPTFLLQNDRLMKYAGEVITGEGISSWTAAYPQLKVFKTNAPFVLANLLHDYLQYLIMVRELATFYASEKMRQENEAIWNIYRLNKKPAP